MWMRYCARALASVWAVWWTLFMLVSGAPERGLTGILLNSPNALPGLLFLASAIVAWRREAAGGVMLVAVGLLLAIAFIVAGSIRPVPRSTIALMIPIIALPPIVAGILFLVSWRKSRN